MKKKIAILLSAMMVATAMPFSATAAEFEAKDPLNPAYAKADKTIDPRVKDSNSAYGAQTGDSVSVQQLTDRQSALKIAFKNDGTSGTIPKGTTFKIKLENGTFDDTILSKYQFVNSINGKAVGLDVAMTNRNGSTATTPEEVFSNILNNVSTANNPHGWTYVDNNGKATAVDGTISLNNTGVRGHVAVAQDIMAKAAETSVTKTQNLYYGPHPTDSSKDIIVVTGTISGAGSAGKTVEGIDKTGLSNTAADGKIQILEALSGTSVADTTSGWTAVTANSVNFDGNTSTTTAAAFAGVVNYLNNLSKSGNYDFYADDTAIKTAAENEYKDAFDTKSGSTNVQSELDIFYIPYKLTIDNETTASVELLVDITDDNSRNGVSAKETRVIATSGSDIKKSGTSLSGTFNASDIAAITEVTPGNSTTTWNNTISLPSLNVGDFYMSLPLGAVVADSEAPVKATVDGSYTDKVVNKTVTITKGDIEGSTSLVYPESSIKRFDEDIMLSPIVLKENASRTIGKHVSNDTSTPDTDIFLRLSGGFRYKLDPNKYVVNSSTGEITAQGTGSIKYNPATGEGLISDDSGNIQNWDNLTVKAYLINESTIKFTVQGLQNKNTREKAIGFRFSNLAVEPTNNKNFGDVTLSVSGDGINSASTVVARREQLGFKLETLQDPKNIVVGRYYVADNNEVKSSNAGLTTGGTKNGTMLEEKNTTVEIKFSEAIPNTLVESRALNFNVPEGVKIVDAEIYDSKNLKNFDDTDFEITNNGTTLKLNRKNVSSSYEVANKDKIAEFKMKLSLSVDPAYSEENITLGVTGGGQSETVETVIAKAKKPFEVTTTTTKANMGYQTYNTANITITETEPGMFLENREVVLNLVAPYGTAELGFSEATYKVDGEELKVDDRSFKVGDYKNGGNTNYGIIRFEIDKASHKTANSITIENVKVGTTRSVPYGSYALGISGDAVINNYNEDVKDNKDFAIASKLPSDNGSDLANLYMQNNTSRFEVKEYVNIITETGTFDDVVRVTIGEKTVLIGDKAVDMDVAPYIQASSNSTMVPLRFVSVALGVDSSSIDNPDASNKIAWDANTKTTTIYYGEGTGQKIIQFQAGSNIMTVDGTRIPMEYGVKAEIKDGRMFVPFRALGQALGINVQWDPDTRTAIYNADKVANTAVATTTATESTTESTTASDTTTESTTASDSTTETTTTAKK